MHMGPKLAKLPLVFRGVIHTDLLSWNCQVTEPNQGRTAPTNGNINVRYRVERYLSVSWLCIIEGI